MSFGTLLALVAGKLHRVTVDEYHMCILDVPTPTHSATYGTGLSVAAVVNIFVPCVCCAVAYVAIFVRLRKKRRLAAGSLPPQLQKHKGAKNNIPLAAWQVSRDTRDNTNAATSKHAPLKIKVVHWLEEKRRLRAVKILAWSYCVTMCCLMPGPLIRAFSAVVYGAPPVVWFPLVCRVVALFVTSTCPLVYVLVMPEMRRAYRKLYSKLKLN